MTKLALGTASFGMPYGIAGNPLMSVQEMTQILDHAKAHGVTLLDTAPVYGEAEMRLGNYGMHDWQVITKLPPIPFDCDDVKSWVCRTVRGSLERLRVPRLHALLLHRPMDLLGPHGEALIPALLLLKRQNIVKHLGVSINSPEELDALWASSTHFPVDLVQSPFNVLDRRLADSGWLTKLHEAGIQVHVRSVFLQGLLLQYPKPNKFDRWKGVWARWEDYLDVNDRTPLQACLEFALSYPQIHRVVVGVDSDSQLTNIVEAMSPPGYPSFLIDDALDLITPSRWKDL